MAKRFPRVRCSEVTVTTINKEPEIYTVPSLSAAEALAQFNRPDANVEAKGNYWAQVTETDGTNFTLLRNDGLIFYLEPGDYGYQRLLDAYHVLMAEIEKEQRKRYE